MGLFLEFFFYTPLGEGIDLCLTNRIYVDVLVGDLVEREGLHYQKFTDVPFTGEVTGQEQGSFKNGKRDGSWVSYHDNGQLSHKGTFKNGKKDGPWVGCDEDGTLDEEYTGAFKNDEKVK